MESGNTSERPPNFESNGLVELVKQRGWPIAVLLLVLPPVLFPFALKIENEEARATVAVTVAVAWLAISIPVSILVFLDWFRSPSTSAAGRGLRNIARAPVFVFGAIAVLIGVCGLAWLAYNVLVERQPEVRWSSIEIVGAMVSIIMYGVYLIRVSLRS
jgi:hypothetical protein